MDCPNSRYDSGFPLTRSHRPPLRHLHREHLSGSVVLLPWSSSSSSVPSVVVDPRLPVENLFGLFSFAFIRVHSRLSGRVIGAGDKTAAVPRWD